VQCIQSDGGSGSSIFHWILTHILVCYFQNQFYRTVRVTNGDNS
jgi:hypothetical protein